MDSFYITAEVRMRVPARTSHEAQTKAILELGPLEHIVGYDVVCCTQEDGEEIGADGTVVRE